MKRTTVFMPEELERDLYAYAKRSGKPAAAIVREAIAAYIVGGANAAALPSFVGAFDSGHTDTAERHNELLFARLSPHREPAVPSRRASRPRRVAPLSRKRR
jgi:hypothetical protein